MLGAQDSRRQVGSFEGLTVSQIKLAVEGTTGIPADMQVLSTPDGVELIDRLTLAEYRVSGDACLKLKLKIINGIGCGPHRWCLVG